jgi:hypothetical protein
MRDKVESWGLAILLDNQQQSIDILERDRAGI